MHNLAIKTCHLRKGSVQNLFSFVLKYGVCSFKAIYLDSYPVFLNKINTYVDEPWHACILIMNINHSFNLTFCSVCVWQKGKFGHDMSNISHEI